MNDNVALINDTTDQNNWGCHATTENLKTIIKKNFNIHYVMKKNIMEGATNKKIKSVANNYLPNSILHYAKKLKYELTSGKFSGYLDYVPATYVQFKTFTKNLNKYSKLITDKTLLECDRVIINGEGSIYDTQRKGRYLLALSYLLIKKYNKSVSIVNHTVKLNDPELKKIAESVYPLFSNVYVREEDSKDELDSICDSKFIPDSVFYMGRANNIIDIEKSEIIDKKVLEIIRANKYITIGGSSMFERYENYINPYDKYQNLILKLRKLNIDIILIRSSSGEDKFLEKLANDHNIACICTKLDYKVAFKIISNSKMHLGGRWHPAIFATLGQSPSFLLGANTHKNNGLHRMFPDYTEVLDYSDLGLKSDYICNKINYIINNDIKVPSPDINKYVQLSDDYIFN